MPKYKVKQTDILHNGAVYAEGTTIELEDEHAKHLADYLELIQGTENPKKEEIKQVKPVRDRSVQSKPVKQAEVAEPQPQKEPETMPVTDTTTVQAETAAPPATTEVKPKTTAQVPPAAQKVIASTVAQVNKSIQGTSVQGGISYQISPPTNMREA